MGSREHEIFTTWRRRLKNQAITAYLPFAPEVGRLPTIKCLNPALEPTRAAS